MNRVKRLLSYLLPYRARALAAFACMAVLAVTTAIYAFLVGPLLALLVTGDWQEAVPESMRALLPALSADSFDRDRAMLLLPLLLVGVAIAKGAAYAGQFYLMGTIGQNVVADLRKELFGKLMSMPPSFWARRHSGDLHSRLNTDVVNIEAAIVWALSSYARDTLQVVVLLVQAFVLDWRLSIIAFGALPVVILPVIRFAKWLKRVTMQSNVVMGDINTVAHEALSGVRVVQAFGAEDRERARYASAIHEHLAVMRRSLLIRATSTPTMEIIAIAGVGAAVAYAGKAVASGEIEGRLFMSFIATVLLMVQPAKALGRVGNFMIQGLAGAERVFEILDVPQEIADAPNARTLPPIADSLFFDDVTLRYETDDEPEGRAIIRGLSLRVRQGEVVALVGPSGAGKSSLANLVPRFYDPTEGAVRIDGVDLREVTLASLRAQIALVTQETVLFNESVAANIAYGRADATREEIEQAAKAAHAHDFILELPKGYETRVGEKGVSLSGGQRQRLAIARAILKDAPILVLDEATSALDTHSEVAVQQALDELMKNRTVVVIAHRLSTIRGADRIVVLVDGRIVEEGSHDELVARNGEYAAMLSLQSGRARDAV